MTYVLILVFAKANMFIYETERFESLEACELAYDEALDFDLNHRLGGNLVREWSGCFNRNP